MEVEKVAWNYAAALLGKNQNLLGEHLWMVEANPPLHFALLLGGAIHIGALKRPLRLERMLVSQTCDVNPSWR